MPLLGRYVIRASRFGSRLIRYGCLLAQPACDFQDAGTTGQLARVNQAVTSGMPDPLQERRDELTCTQQPLDKRQASYRDALMG